LAQPWRLAHWHLVCSSHPMNTKPLAAVLRRWRVFGVAKMPDIPDEAVIREKAKTVVLNGKLPARRPDRTWGGPGVGAPCIVCELPVTKDQLEFEIQFARDGDNPGLDKFHIHIRCFAAWEFERRNMGGGE
jgi:hypothetical protein